MTQLRGIERGIYSINPLTIKTTKDIFIFFETYTVFE